MPRHSFYGILREGLRMPKLRHAYTHDFTILSNQLIRDARLSYKARGIFLYLWYLPDDWDISLADLQKHSAKDGQASVRQGVAKLQQRGYLSFRRVHAPTGGKFTDTEWTITDMPSLDFPKMDKPTMDKPKMDKPKMENPSLENRNTLKDYPDPSTIFPSTIFPSTEDPPLSPQGDDVHSTTREVEHLGRETKNDAKPTRRPRRKMAAWDASPLPGSPASTTPPRRHDYSPGFTAWWNAYPPTRRLSKPQCFLVWTAEHLEARADELIGKLERLKETTWQHTEPCYIKTSLPYLNSGRYEDDLVPLPALPTQQESGLSPQGYRAALTSQKIMQEMQQHDAGQSGRFLPGPGPIDGDIS
jgi:hypothetical protein